MSLAEMSPMEMGRCAIENRIKLILQLLVSDKDQQETKPLDYDRFASTFEVDEKDLIPADGKFGSLFPISFEDWDKPVVNYLSHD